MSEIEKIDFSKLEQALLDLQKRVGGRKNPPIGIYQLKKRYLDEYMKGGNVTNLRRILCDNPMFDCSENFSTRTVRFSESHFQLLMSRRRGTVNESNPSTPKQTKGKRRVKERRSQSHPAKRRKRPRVVSPLATKRKKKKPPPVPKSNGKSRAVDQEREEQSEEEEDEEEEGETGKPQKNHIITRKEQLSNILPEYKLHLIVDIRRIEEFVNQIDEVEDMYFNPSKLFRSESFVGLNQKIHNIIFFDSGREKEFRDFSKRKTETLDGIFETIVSDPINDSVLKEFLDDIRKNFNVIDPENERDRVQLNIVMEDTAALLIREVIDFYGGIQDDEDEKISRECKEVIQLLKHEKKNNLIFLGELKGCGECRHRSILFKVVCDLIGIPCRILRGWIELNNQSYSHMWNEIVIGKSSHTIDTMNFNVIVDPKISSKHYRNLGHPLSLNKMQRQTLQNLQRQYRASRGDVIGAGGFGVVFEVKAVDVCVEEEEEDNNSTNYSSQIKKKKEKIKYVTKKMDLAVKEVNITKNNILIQSTHSRSGDGDDEPPQDCMKMVKKEIEMMKLFRHPNIVEIIGSFTSRKKPLDELIVHVVMKRYDYCGLKFLQLLQKLGKDYYKKNNNNTSSSSGAAVGLSPEKQTTEVLILLIEVAKGLLFIHSFGIVHYDIKLSNILVSWDYVNNKLSDVVIADFGSTKEEKMNFLLTSLPAVTESFAAPEILGQLRKRKKFMMREGGKTIKLPSYTTKSDIYSYGKLMSKFFEYYEEFPRIQGMVKKCLMDDPRDRPSLWEIIYHLRSSLEYKKNLMYQELIGGSVPTEITFSSLLFGGGGGGRRGSGRINRNNIVMKQQSNQRNRLMKGKMKKLINLNRIGNTHQLELIKSQNEFQQLKEENKTQKDVIEENLKKMSIQQSEIDDLRTQMSKTSDHALNIQKKCKAEEAELKNRIALLEDEIMRKNEKLQKLQRQQKLQLQKSPKHLQNGSFGKLKKTPKTPRIVIPEDAPDDEIDRIMSHYGTISFSPDSTNLSDTVTTSSTKNKTSTTSTPKSIKEKAKTFNCLENSKEYIHDSSRTRNNSLSKKQRKMIREYKRSRKRKFMIHSSKKTNNSTEDEGGKKDFFPKPQHPIYITSPTIGDEDDDENSILLLDCGSYSWKFGTAGKDSPDVIFPSTVSRRAKNENVEVGKRFMYSTEEEDEETEGELYGGGFNRSLMVGRNNRSSVKCPIIRGGVSNWNDMDVLLNYTFSGIESRPRHSILISEPPKNSSSSRMMITSRVFDQYNFDSFYLCNTSVLSLFSHGRQDGVVVESGHGLTSVVPIYGGYSIRHAVHKMKLGGKDVNEYLFQSYSASTSSSSRQTNKRWSDDILTQIKHKCCYISDDFQEEICKKDHLIREENQVKGIDHQFVLPDGETVLENLGNTRFTAPEIMFDPNGMLQYENGNNNGSNSSLYFDDRMGVDKCVVDCIGNCDRDLEELLFENICMTGGNTLFPGFQERLQRCVQSMAPRRVLAGLSSSPSGGINVESMLGKNYNFEDCPAWFGAAVLVGLPIFSEMKITKEEYVESGESVVLRKCLM